MGRTRLRDIYYQIGKEIIKQNNMKTQQIEEVRKFNEKVSATCQARLQESATRGNGNV